MHDLPDTAKPALAAKVRLKWDEIRQKPLLLFPEGVLVLNPTAHEIVALCDGQSSIAEIARKLGEKFGGNPVHDDIKALLARLIGKGLMTVAA